MCYIVCDGVAECMVVWVLDDHDGHSAQWLLSTMVAQHDGRSARRLLSTMVTQQDGCTMVAQHDVCDVVCNGLYNGWL